MIVLSRCPKLRNFKIEPEGRNCLLNSEFALLLLET